MTGDNLIEAVVAEKADGFGGVIKLVRSEFDVLYKNGLGEGPYQLARSVSWQVLGLGQNSLGTTEATARDRFERA